MPAVREWNEGQTAVRRHARGSRRVLRRREQGHVRRSCIASRRPTSATTSCRRPTVKRCTTAVWSDAPRPASWRCRDREVASRSRRCVAVAVVATATVIGVRLCAASAAVRTHSFVDRSLRRAGTAAATDAGERSAISTVDAAGRRAGGIRRCLADARGPALLSACRLQSRRAGARCGVELLRRSAHRRFDDNDAARAADVRAEHTQRQRQAAADRTRHAAGDVLLEARSAGSAPQPDALRRQHSRHRRREPHLFRQGGRRGSASPSRWRWC